MKEEKIIRDWIQLIRYDKLYDLNDKQLSLLKELNVDTEKDNYILKFFKSTVMKKDNEKNLENYTIFIANEWDNSKKIFIEKEVVAAKRHWLANIMSRTHPELGKRLRKRSEEVRLSALEYGLILPEC